MKGEGWVHKGGTHSICDLELGKHFLNMIEKAAIIKEKDWYVRFIKIKNVFSWEDYIKKMNR